MTTIANTITSTSTIAITIAVTIAITITVTVTVTATATVTDTVTFTVTVTVTVSVTVTVTVTTAVPSSVFTVFCIISLITIVVCSYYYCYCCNHWLCFLFSLLKTASLRVFCNDSKSMRPITHTHSVF